MFGCSELVSILLCLLKGLRKPGVENDWEEEIEMCV